MANANKVILIGNVTRDLELSYLPNQNAVVNFGIAMNRKWKSATGEAKEEVCFIDCQAFAKSAETLNKYVKKGDPIYLEGRLKFEQWEAKDGSKHSRHRVIVDSFQFLSTKKHTETTAPTEPDQHPDSDPTQPKDDIPF
jgi:single-strand DNA-binding protein